MGSKCGIPVLLLFFLFLSLPSLAAQKVYTNADLKPPAPTLERDSRIDPVTGKVIPGKSHDMERSDDTADGIVARAEHQAGKGIKEIRKNKAAFAALTGFLFLIWTACLVDILRNEFRGNNKLIWFIAVTFIPVAGFILYFFIGTRQKKYRFIRDYER